MGISDNRIAARVQQLKMDKVQNEIQRKLIRLAELPVRSPSQDKELRALYRLDAIEVRAAAVRNETEQFYIEQRTREQLERDARLVILGGYITTAGLEHLEDAVLLGTLFHLAEQVSGPSGTDLQRRVRARGEVELMNLAVPKTRKVSLFNRSKW